MPGLWTLPHTARRASVRSAGRAMPAACSSAGWTALSRPKTIGGRAGTRAGVVAVRARRAHAVSRPGSPRRARRAGPHPRRALRCGAAGYEASGFVVRQLIELERQHRASRIVATGGGTRVAAVDAGASPTPPGCRSRCRPCPRARRWERRSSGRMAAGLESSIADAARWASTERAAVEPDPAWEPTRCRTATPASSNWRSRDGERRLIARFSRSGVQ